MKGVIFNIVEDVVSEHLGDEAWDRLLDSAHLDHGHTALGTYPDAELDALVAAAQALDRSPRQIQVWVGARAIPYFHRRYPGFFDRYDTVHDFLPGLDTIIHPEVRKLDREALPPSFACTPVAGAGLSVVYSSHRSLCGLAEGLMYGLGDYYRQTLSITHPACVHHGAGSCRFELVFG